MGGHRLGLSPECMEKCSCQAINGFVSSLSIIKELRTVDDKLGECDVPQPFVV